MKHFYEEKLYHSKVPREFIFGKLRSFHLFSKGKNFQEKSEKAICSDNQIENQTELSLQVYKNFQKCTKFTSSKEKSLPKRIYVLKTNLNL